MTEIPRALRLLRIALNVSDLRRASQFYGDALGFVALPPDGPTQLLRLGAQQIELTESAGAPYPPDSTAADLWFQHFAIVVTDIAAAYARLQHHGATSISQGGPIRLPAASGGVTAYKFRDPDGHPLELIAFPDGTVSEGIDHSALSVADADRSIAFYVGLLGLAPGPRQRNTGPEQDRLDGLPGVSVDVVALLPTGTQTPHVELLGYRSPHGRPSPVAAHDIAATRLVFEADDRPALLRRLADAGCPVAGATLRDPDGHLVVLA